MKNQSLLLSRRALAILALGTLSAASALAQAPAPATATPPAAPGTATTAPAEKPKPLSVNEKKFVKDTGKSLYYQIQLTTAAKTALTDEKLVKLRDTANKDLNKAWDELSKFAQARGETLPVELVGADKSDVERLGKLKEDKFVKQWIEFLNKEAKHLDKDFEQAGKSAQDTDLKTYIQNYGPSIRSLFTSSEAAEKGLKKK